MYSLDTLDRKILVELDKNSRKPIADIARRLKQGRDRVEYRIARMQERKILRKCSASVNLASIGFTIYKLYIRIENDRQGVKELVSHLRKHPRVYWIALSDGGWDLMIAIFARSSVEFYSIQQELLSAFNRLVLAYAMYQLVEIDMYQKGYLAGKTSDCVSVGGSPQVEEIDKLDYKILKQLSIDARKSFAEIAKACSTTQAISRYRIERLERLGVITGYRTEVDLTRIGMQLFKTQLYLRNFDSELQAELRKYCSQNPYITCYIQQLGDCVIELEMEVSSYLHYSDIIDDLRSAFPQLVRNFQTVLIRKTYFNWVPRDLDIEA